MSLIDRTDNVLMLGAYDWAFIKPIRKLYYNMTITAVSVVVAFVVGGIEALSFLADHFNLRVRSGHLSQSSTGILDVRIPDRCAVCAELGRIDCHLQMA